MNTKVTLVLLSVLIFSLGGLSQNDSISAINEEIDTTLPAKKIRYYHTEARGYVDYGSTNLTNEFINKLLFGGRIEQNLKDRVLDRTNNRNRFGLEVNFEGIFVDFKDTVFKKLPQFGYYIGFGSFNNVSASYSRDLFSTVFYGNKQFEGETANLGPSNFVSQKFEKITFGLMKRDYSMSVGVSLIIGDRYDQVRLRQADLFTAPEGTELTMDYNGKVAFSDRDNRSGFMGFSGTGMGIDFMSKLYKNKYTLRVSNFGFAVWARNPSYSNTELSYDFEGIEIDNVFQSSNEEIREEAENLLPGLSAEAFVTMLPTIVRIDKNIDSNENFQYIYGVRYKLLSNYLPSVYGGASYQISPTMRVAGSLAWGGYAGLRAQAGFYYRYKFMAAGIETTNLTGMFFQNGNGNGASLYFMANF